MKNAIIIIFSFLVVAVQSQIRCINFYGIETESKKPVCSWKHPPLWYLSQLKQMMDINTIRLPFSADFIHEGNYEHLDLVIDDAEMLDMQVILDWHRNKQSHQSASPETDLTIDQWIETWTHILRRYHDNPTVYGIGAFNELQTENASYAMTIQRDLVEHLERKFPGRYTYFLGCPEWGENCSGMSFSDMPTWNRTYMEIHKYPFTKDRWDESKWNESIPYDICPSHWFVGETGWKQGKEMAWANKFLSYLSQRNISNLCFWTIAESQDTGGLWKDDCETMEQEKSHLLQKFWNDSLNGV